jgi:ferrous iron transport protein B
MVGAEAFADLRSLMVDGHGWTLLTVVNLMLFSLLHNPCATTPLTMWKETRSLKWTAAGALLLRLVIPLEVCFVMAALARLLGWGL